MEALFYVLSFLFGALGGLSIANFQRITKLENEIRKLKIKEK
jgi:hypothetical protein